MSNRLRARLTDFSLLLIRLVGLKEHLRVSDAAAGCCGEQINTGSRSGSGSGSGSEPYLAGACHRGGASV